MQHTYIHTQNEWELYFKMVMCKHLLTHKYMYIYIYMLVMAALYSQLVNKFKHCHPHKTTVNSTQHIGAITSQYVKPTPRLSHSHPPCNKEGTQTPWAEVSEQQTWKGADRAVSETRVLLQEEGKADRACETVDRGRTEAGQAHLSTLDTLTANSVSPIHTGQHARPASIEKAYSLQMAQ